MKRLFQLAWPILLAQFALTGLGLVDTWAAGQAGATQLAGVALGSNIMLIMLMFGTGVLMVLSPLVAHALATDADEKALAGWLKSARLSGVFLGGVGILILGVVSWALPHFIHADAALLTVAQNYLWAIMPGMAIFFIYDGYRFFWEGHGKTQLTLFFSFVAFVLNIPLDFFLVLGAGDWQGLGGVGCGVASSLLMIGLTIASHLYLQKTPPFAAYRMRTPAKTYLKRLWQVGLPAALALIFEVSLFMVLSLFIAPYGATALAAHQITISITATLYVVPYSLSMAVSIETGRLMGLGDRGLLKQFVGQSLLLAGLVGLLLSLLTWTGHAVLPRLFTADPAVLALASALLLYAVAYQFFDALQSMTAGVLRGMQRTRFTFVATLLSYWGVGLGGGMWLAQHGHGVQGYWMGIVAGLFSAALLLMGRLVVWWRRHPDS
ncbi:MATE family efflux transporter [Alcanivorax sp.]|uniref:MATE family efflux transporter n=1 Tax=Alcanivorax sp. TaxID=1872427 RepID=UPI00258C1817|nr:MATE family efflux transporter [Alcanivorax sp.]